MDYLQDSLIRLRLANREPASQSPDLGSAQSTSFPSTMDRDADLQNMKEVNVYEPVSEMSISMQARQSMDDAAKDTAIMEAEHGDGNHSIDVSLPPTQDEIITILHAFIQKERVCNFSFLASHTHRHMNQEDLLVVSLADADVVDNLCQCTRIPRAVQPDQHWYTFHEVYHSSIGHTVAITIPSGSITSINDLAIFDPRATTLDEKNSPAAVWIRRKYDWGDNLDWEMRFTDIQYKEQQLWWQGTGQHFRFMELPLELREVVYGHILGGVIVPDVFNDGYRSDRVVLGRGLSYGVAERDGLRCDPNVDAPNMLIMQVSRKVRDEATEVAYRLSTKRFCAFGSGETCAHLCNAPQSTIPYILRCIRTASPHASFLRNVQLEMSAVQYFLSVSIQPRSGNPWYTTNLVTQGNAQHTGPTAFGGALFGAGIQGNNAVPPLHPAGHIGGQLLAGPPLPAVPLAPPRRPRSSNFSLRMLSDFPALQTLDFRFISPKNPGAACPWSYGVSSANHSCQKIWIDWFLVFAWPVLRELKTKGVKISLSGCVKNSTRAEWQHILADQGVDHTGRMRVRQREIMKSRSPSIPIPCTCSTPCAGGLNVFNFSEYEVRRIEGLREEKEKYYWDFED